MVGASRSTGWPNWCSAGAGGVACVWDVLAAVRVDYIHDPLPPGSDREAPGNGLRFVAGVHGEISRILRMCVGFRRSMLSLSFSPGWWVCSDGCFFYFAVRYNTFNLLCSSARRAHSVCVVRCAARFCVCVCSSSSERECRCRSPFSSVTAATAAAVECPIQESLVSSLIIIPAFFDIYFPVSFAGSLSRSPSWLTAGRPIVCGGSPCSVRL